VNPGGIPTSARAGLGRRWILSGTVMIGLSSSPLAAQQVVTLERALEMALTRNPTVESAEASAAAASSARWADWEICSTNPDTGDDRSRSINAMVIANGTVRPGDSITKL